MQYPETEPICSCDECVYKFPKQEWCHRLSVELPKGRRCSLSIRKTPNAPHQAQAVASRPECGCSQEDQR
jgi:hypothetical protein